MPVHAPAGAGESANPRGLFARGSQVSVELYRSTPSTARSTRGTTKRTTITAHPVPRAKRQCVCGQPKLDSSTSSGDDSEVFDEVPLTRADIPKIVEAVMNQFSSDPREEMRDSPHLGKLVYNFALHV